jgi:DNA-binding XRE family transcriptional regulator
MQGDVLKKYRKEQKMNQSEMADELGVSLRTYSDYENNHTDIPLSIVKLFDFLSKNKNADSAYPPKVIANQFNEAPSNYANMKPPKVVVVDSEGNNTIVRIDHKAAAGLPAHIDDADFYKQLPAFTLPFQQFNSGDWICLQVTGESMHPTVINMDWIICKRIYNLNDIRDGYVHILVTSDGVVCKRLLNRSVERNTIVCQSDNWTYPTYEVDLPEVIAIYSASLKMSSNFTDYGKADRLFSKLEKLEEAYQNLESKINKMEKTNLLSQNKLASTHK